DAEEPNPVHDSIEFVLAVSLHPAEYFFRATASQSPRVRSEELARNPLSTYECACVVRVRGGSDDIAPDHTLRRHTRLIRFSPDTQHRGDSVGKRSSWPPNQDHGRRAMSRDVGARGIDDHGEVDVVRRDARIRAGEE